MASTDENNPCRHPDTAFRTVGEEGGLVVLPGRAEVKVLNPVASTVFGLLDGSHSIDEIVSKITEEFDVEPGQARGDVESFLRELETHGMLAVSTGGAPEQSG